MDYSKLKVTELKEILTSRGLSTKGVKAELITRLEGDDAAPAAPSPAPEEAEVEIPSAEPGKVDEPDATAPAPQSELSPRPHPEASQLMKQTAEAEGVVETLEAQDEVEIQAEQEEETGPDSAQKPPVEDAPASLTSRLGVQQEEEEEVKNKSAQEEEEEGGPSMLSAIASAHSAGVEAIVPGESSTSPLQAESASAATPKPPRKAAKGAAPLSSLAPPHPPTRALRVTGLVRPMMLPSLKEMLRERFGELDENEDVKGGVWLDGIKSAGWIVFKEASSAQQLFETFDSKPFPSSDSFRTPVSFFYVPAEQVPRLLQEEEAFWEKERGRMEIVASTSQPADGEEERKYEYSARPVRQQKKIRDPKPPPPSATAAHSTTAAPSGQGLSIRGSGFNKRAGAAVPAGTNGASTAIDPLVDASSLPPVSFPPVRSPKQDRSRDEGRGRGGRSEGRYQPYPPADDRNRDRPAGIALVADYAKASAPSSAAGPLRDAQTELELSRSRDAAASAYAGRGGRGPPGPPLAAYDSRRDDYGAARGGYDLERGGGRGYDRPGGGGYAHRGGYERYNERDRDGRRRAYDYDYDYGHDRRAPAPTPAARDERGYSSRSNGHGGGGFRDAQAVRGASPGWMGDRPPPVAAPAPAPAPARAGGEDRRDAHGRDRERERERDRYDRASASRDDYAGGRGGGGGRDRDRGKRERSPRGTRGGAVEEDRYVPRARNERD